MKKLIIGLIVIVLFSLVVSAGVPVNSILSNALSGVRGGGLTSTGEFDPVSISSSDFDGFNSKSIVFYTGDLPNSRVVQDEHLEFIYDGDGFLASAQVLCKLTGLELSEEIDKMQINKEIEPTTICGEDEHQPCCVIIFQKGMSFPTVDEKNAEVVTLMALLVAGLAAVGIIFFAHKKIKKSKS